jgi:flagellar basal-body rod protein FlgF
MNSGLYSAYSGLRANADMLEVLANNLANLNTTGFKGDETFFRLYNRAVSESGLPPLDQAINDSTVVQGTVVNFQGGPMTATGRDLDAALEGAGFFVVETPAGARYTRNGHFQVNSQGRLVTSEGFTVMGKGGAITLPPGKVSISQNGAIEVNGTAVDSLKIVDIADKTQLQKAGSSMFQAKAGAVEQEVRETQVRQGSLEQSNINPVQQMMLMINMMRQFEGLQKAINTVMNTLNEKSVNQVGKPAL